MNMPGLKKGGGRGKGKPLDSISARKKRGGKNSLKHCGGPGGGRGKGRFRGNCQIQLEKKKRGT